MNRIIFKTILLKGENGNSIRDIVKTSTDGLIDTYTVTLTDGSTTTFEVSNGNGIESIEKTATSGLTDTYTITFTNGETYSYNVVNGANMEVDDELSTTSENPVQNKVITQYLESICNLIYPIGSIYLSVNNVNPSTLFGGTWVAWGSGKVPIGVDTSDADFNTVEKTGGDKTESYTPSGNVAGHTLTVNEIPSHNHPTSTDNTGLEQITHINTPNISPKGYATSSGAHLLYWDSYAHTQIITKNVGGGQAHNHGFNGSASDISHVQPYITCYMWKRTA